MRKFVVSCDGDLDIDYAEALATHVLMYGLPAEFYHRRERVRDVVVSSKLRKGLDEQEQAERLEYSESISERGELKYEEY